VGVIRRLWWNNPVRQLWLRARYWWYRHAPAVSRVALEQKLAEADECADRIVSAYQSGRAVGQWEMFRITDELERLRRHIAQAALDGNGLAAELLTSTIAKPLVSEAAVDMNEAVRLHERQRFLRWLVEEEFDNATVIARQYLADVEGGKV